MGDVVPELVRTISLVDMVAYAGATWDWHRMHYDPQVANEGNLPGPIVDGQVYGALLVEQIQDWLGPRCFVRELGFRFRNLVFAGERLRCEGTVAQVENDALVLDLRVVVIDAEGEQLRVAAAPARARVLLNTSDGPGA